MFVFNFCQNQQILMLVSFVRACHHMCHSFINLAVKTALLPESRTAAHYCGGTGMKLLLLELSSTL